MIIAGEDFFLKNLWWIVLIAALAAGGLILFLRFRPKRKQKQIVNISGNLEAIGGADNVLSHTLEGSRIVLQLKDYGKVDREKLKTQGATGFLLKSDKLTIVFKDGAKDVYRALFPEGK